MAQLTGPEITKRLQDKFKGKRCRIEIPNYAPVFGLVDEISLEVIKEPLVIVQMNDRRYSMSLESYKECLKLLK